MSAAIAASSLLAPWTGPFGGVPPFDRVAVDGFAPALEEGMRDALAEIEAIASSAEPPTFENTIVAMEKCGAALRRAATIFGTWSSSRSSDAFREVEVALSPKLAAHADAIVQNAKLFSRVKAVWSDAQVRPLPPEAQRLVKVVYDHFVKEGAALDDEAKRALSALNQELATLTTQFAQNQLGDEEELALVITDRERLAGLSTAQIAAAAAEAERRGLSGRWVIANTRSSMEPFLTSAADRALREEAFRIWTRRGDNGDARDNNALASRILSLRAKKAKLLGFPTYAHWKTSDQMAKTPEAALALMHSVWAPAIEAFRRDVAACQAIVDAEGGGFRIAPWDYRYYAEKLRKARFDLDLDEVKPYLGLESLREAMFLVARRLYGLSFTRVEGVPTFDPEQSVYEVKDEAGAHVGLWYFDPYARPGKASGAWMSAYREQQRLEAPEGTLVSNNSNFVRGEPGARVTVSWDDARTMFHEFGHALHGLLSRVTYPTLSGTNTARDFVELPSQFHEHYLRTPEVMALLVDAEGRRIPDDLVARIERAETFNQGFSVAEIQASAIVDMALHLAGETPIDTRTFEKQKLAELGMPDELVMRHRIPAFGHVFSGDGYAAGYYSYLWAEVLEQDAFAAFVEAGDPYDRALASKLRATLLSVGNTIDPGEAFVAFRGRPPSPDALLRAKGFAIGA